MSRPRGRRRRLPRLELRARRGRGGRAASAARPSCCGTATHGCRRTSTRSCSPAGSPTATTCGPAPSPASRRSWTRCAAFAADGGPVVGICNGFQVLTEAGLLPGRAAEERGLKFLCTTVDLRRRDRTDIRASPPRSTGDVLRIPINHFEGNYTCDAETLAELRERRSDRAPLRRQPERLGRRHRRDLQRAAQRGRPDAPPRAGLPRAAGLDRRAARCLPVARSPTAGDGEAGRAASALHRAADPGLLQHRGVDAELAPRGVGDALALAVAAATSTKSFSRPVRSTLAPMASSSSWRSRRSWTSCRRFSGSASASSSVDLGQALLDRVRGALAASLRACCSRAPRDSGDARPWLRPSARAALCSSVIGDFGPRLLRGMLHVHHRNCRHSSRDAFAVSPPARQPRCLAAVRCRPWTRQTDDAVHRALGPHRRRGAIASPRSSAGEPNHLELAMYSVMWSEHCSYKSSRIHLRRLPTEAP